MPVTTPRFPEDFSLPKRQPTFIMEPSPKNHLKLLEKRKGGDITGYTIEEYAKDVNDLMTALGM